MIKTTFSATSVADFEAVGVDVALAAAFTASFGNGSNFDAFTLRAQEAAFNQVDSAVLEQTEWTVGGLPAVNFYAVRTNSHIQGIQQCPSSDDSPAACMCVTSSGFHPSPTVLSPFSTLSSRCTSCWME